MQKDPIVREITRRNCSEISISELKSLKPEDIAIIEAALKTVNPFGEVQLVITNGRISVIRTIQSEVIDHLVE